MGGTETETGDGEYRELLGDPRLLTILSMSVAGTMGVNVASPALPAMGEGLAVSDARIGLVMTAYTLPAMVVVPFTGTLADLYGRRRVVLPCLLGFALAGGAIAFADSFAAVLVLRGIQGAAVSGFMPLSVTLLGDLSAGSKGATAQGLRVGSNGISSAAVPVAAGALSGLAWQVPFLLYAGVLVVFAVAYVLLPETTGGIDAGDEGPDGGTVLRYLGTLRTELDDTNLRVLVSGGFARDFVRYAVLTFVPLFAVRGLGASFAAAGAVLSVRGAAYILVSPFAGRIAARFSRKGAIAGSLALSGASVALMPAAPSIVALGALVGTFHVGDSVFSPVIKDAVTDAVAADARAGVVNGMQVLKYAGQTASPAGLGVVLAVAGFDALFLLTATVTAAYVVAVLLVLEPVPAEAGG